MIAITDQAPGASPPPPARPTPEFRARRGRLATLGSLVLGLALLVACTAPLGAFYPLLYFGVIFVVPFLVVLVFGFVHTLYAWRRAPGTGFGAALLWWLAPVVILTAAVWLARGPLPGQVGFRIAKPGLDALLRESAGVEAADLTLPDRWLGAWPAKKITRYRDGQVRMELEGNTSWFGERGLLWTNRGLPMPGQWQPTKTLGLGDGWYAWFRESMH